MKDDWHEQGNDLHKLGTISHTRLPRLLWLADRWLSEAHEWPYRIPGYASFWNKVSPNWGDPFCAAYCFVFSPYVFRHTKDVKNYEVGWDALSDEFKEWYHRDMDLQDDESEPLVETIAS
jgi:hypothetical protein